MDDMEQIRLIKRVVDFLGGDNMFKRYVFGDGKWLLTNGYSLTLFEGRGLGKPDLTLMVRCLLLVVFIADKRVVAGAYLVRRIPFVVGRSTTRRGTTCCAWNARQADFLYRQSLPAARRRNADRPNI